MLGSDFIKTQSHLWDIVPFTSKDLDIRDGERVTETVLAVHPDFVLNCAAYTKVDDAEDIWRKDNFDINALGVFHLAKACAEIGCGFVTISTDYVFDGTKGSGYAPMDQPNPVNAYGMAKYLGERLSRETYSQTIVIRTSWLYGWNPDSRNFVNTMLRLGGSKSEIQVVNDQYWAPTYTYDLCDRISSLLLRYAPNTWRILHCSNATESKTWITWHEFASEVFRIRNTKTLVVPVSSDEYLTKARRPRKSLLQNPDEAMPDWKNALSRYLDTKSKTI